MGKPGLAAGAAAHGGIRGKSAGSAPGEYVPGRDLSEAGKHPEGKRPGAGGCPVSAGAGKRGHTPGPGKAERWGQRGYAAGTAAGGGNGAASEPVLPEYLPCPN